MGQDRYYTNTYPHELDGGRRQRIGIAKALALTTNFIVCDEPVSALDVFIQARNLNLMVDFKDAQKLTYMFIFHDQVVVHHITDKVLVLYNGKPAEKAPVEELFARPMHLYTQALLSAIPVPDPSYKSRPPGSLKGEVASPINPPPGCRFLSRCPNAMDACSRITPLEKVSPGHMMARHPYIDLHPMDRTPAGMSCRCRE